MINKENQEIVNTENMSTRYGLAAGVGMSFILLLFQLSGNDFSPFSKLVKYLVLALVVIVSLNNYKKLVPQRIFIKGIPFGLKLSLVAAITMVLINIVLFLINTEIAFSKYSLVPNTIPKLGMISGVLFFETLVFGSLITFMVLQYLKGPIKR